MGETRRKRDKRPPIKPTEKLSPLPIANDKALNEAQRSHCRNIIDKMLSDETSLSFSKPVNELWHPSVLTDYFEKIENPMDLGTVKKRIVSTYNAPGSDYFDPNAFRVEARLVFLNAISYNGKGSDLGRLGTKFIHFIDSKLEELPVPPDSQQGEQQQQQQQVDRDKSGGDSKQDDDDDDDDDDDNNNDDLQNGDNSSHPNSNAADKHVGGSSNAAPTTPQKKKKSMSSSKRSSETDTKDDDVDDDDDDENNLDDNNDGMADTNGEEDNDEERDGKHQQQDVKMEDKDDDTPGNSGSKDNDERMRLENEIATLSKTISRANANLAEIELEKNVPLTYEENSKLRDEVEGLTWDMSQKVVEILRKHVDDALKNSDEDDPEFVTLEFSTVEPKLLREIEALIRPDERITKEKSTISQAEREMESAKRKLKRLNDGSMSASKKKRTKKAR